MGVTIERFWILFWIYEGRHYREILNTLLDLLRASKREIVYTIFDILSVSLSRNIGYYFGFTKGVTIAKFWILFWIYSGRHYREILDTILGLLRALLSRNFGYTFGFTQGVTIATFWI